MEEQLYRCRNKNTLIRPFSCLTKIKTREYSIRLQRIITDFGCDFSFAISNNKIQFHYGISLPNSSIRRITLEHAKDAKKYEQENSVSIMSHSSTIISETDGSMVPIVEYDEPNNISEKIDKRKHKSLVYKEAKLSMARNSNKITAKYYAATMGDKEKAARNIKLCLNKVGFNKDSRVHAVGDGAPWIAEIYNKIIGTQGNYLIDYYHMLEYLNSAAKRYVRILRYYHNDPHTMADSVINDSIKKIKNNKIDEVTNKFRNFVEEKDLCERPVGKFVEYVGRRKEQFKYKDAIEQELPIGSGEIESAHRYISQRRLKIAGAWWKKNHAENMLGLRAMNANQTAEKYWNMKKALAA